MVVGLTVVAMVVGGGLFWVIVVGSGWTVTVAGSATAVVVGVVGSAGVEGAVEMVVEEREELVVVGSVSSWTGEEELAVGSTTGGIVGAASVG